jgi:hypothetical protein
MLLRMMRCLAALMLAIAANPLAAQSSCTSDAVSRAASVVQQRRADLLKVKVEEMATEVSPSLQMQIHLLKDSLTDAIDLEMACAPTSEGANALQMRLAKLLNANLPEKPFQPSPTLPADAKQPVYDDQVYGADLKVAVSAPANQPAMRIVDVSFGIQCGSDTLVLIYAPDAVAWHRLLRWQSPNYKEISGAFGDLFLAAILPDTSLDKLRVVVAHGTPWCTSRFSGFGIDVLASQASADATPRVVWHTARGYSRGDFVPRLRATADGFEFRINAPALDTTGFERNVIYRYRIDHDGVTRIGPIATNGRGFVEEWLSMPWNEAIGQTDPASVSGMKTVHDKVEQAGNDSKTYISYTYGPVRSCLPKAMYEVEMDADPGGPQFFTIRESTSGYAMVNYSTVQDERCSGPDLMQNH